MSTNATLKAEKRTESGKGVARKLRAAGRIPGVVYGQGDDGLLLTLDALETTNLFHHISVENTIVNLDVGGEKTPIATLVREVQVHPFRPDILHVDFYKIQKGVEVEVNVPLHLTGTAKGVKQEGGVLQQLFHDLAVRTIPSKIPEEITYDVSELGINDQVLLKELELPEDVTVQVLNGVGRPGVAGDMAEFLVDRGFVVLEVGNANRFSDRAPTRTRFASKATGSTFCRRAPA